MKSTQGRSRTKRAGQFEFNDEEPIRVPGFFCATLWLWRSETGQNLMEHSQLGMGQLNIIYNSSEPLVLDR